MTSRNYYFDNIKGLLILLVIIGNSLEFFEQTSTVNSHYFILVLYLFHMPFFAFISGYFYKLSTRTPGKMIKKTLLLYTGFQIFYTFFEKILYNSTEFDLQLFYPQWTLWYLLTLTCLYIIGSYIKNYKNAFFITLALSMLIGYDTSVGTHLSLSRTFFFLPFFLLGALYKEEYLIKIKKYIKIIIPFTLVLLLTLFFIKELISVDVFFEYTYYKYHFDKEYYSLMLRAFHYISAFCIGSIILCYTPQKHTFFSYLGKNSLILYLCHSGVIKLLSKTSLLNYTSLTHLIFSEFIIIIITCFTSYIYLKIKSITYNYYKLKHN